MRCIVQCLHRQPFAHALAAGLVVAPQRADAGVVEHVQQRLVRADLLLIVIVAAIGREQAGQRHFGAGAARMHVREVDRAGLRQLRRGLPGVAVQAPVLRAHGFAHHDHQQPRPAVGRARGGLGIQPDRQLRCALDRVVAAQRLGQAQQVVARRGQVAHLALVAHQRRHFLERQQRTAQCHGGRQQQEAATPQQCLAPAAAQQLHAPQHDHRQRRQQHQRGDQAGSEELAAFLVVGRQHVAQHVRIQVDVVAAHVMGGHRRAQQQHADHHLGVPAPHQQAHQQAVRADQQQQQRKAEAQAARMGGHRAVPEQAVAGQREEHAGERDEGFGGPGRAPVAQG